MAVLQNSVLLLSQIRKKFPEAEKEDWILRLDDRKKPKRSCVVCVARRPPNAEVPSEEPKYSLISFTLNSDHTITDAQFRDPQSDLNATDVVGRCIDELCCKDDKSVLDTLLDSVAECSAELRLCIKEYVISTRAHTLKTNACEERLVLECAVIRCVKHCLQKSCSVAGCELLKPSSSSESLQRLVQTSSDQRRRNSAPSESFSQPLAASEVPSCPQPDPTATVVESSVVKFETLSPPPSIPNQARCPRAGAVASTDALSQLWTTIFSEADSMGEFGGDSQRMLSTPLVAQLPPPPHLPPTVPAFQFYSHQMFYAPCSSSLPPASICPPQYIPTEVIAPPPVELTKNGKVKKPRRPRQPKAGARPRGGGKRKAAAPDPAINSPLVSNVVQWHPHMGVPPGTSVQCITGPPKVRDALLKSLLQSSHASDPPPTRCSSSSSLCSPVSDPAPVMRSQSENQPSFAYHEQMWAASIPEEARTECLPCIPSTSTTSLPQTIMYQTTMTSSQPSHSGGYIPSRMPSSASLPQLGNLYTTQLSPSACCSYTNSPVGANGDCATTVYDRGVSSMVVGPGMQMNCGGTTGPVMQSPQGALTQQQQSEVMQQQWSAPQQEYMYQQQSAMYQQQQPAVSTGVTQMKSSTLKRKTNMSQAAQAQHEMPSKLVHISQPQYAAYQQPSPQYQQPSASPQFPSQSTTPASNRLSPYASYEGPQSGMCSMGGMGQWSKRPPSRSELIRMELRQSVHARQHAASPNHQNVLSPNDLGAPRFAGPAAYSQMMSPPRMNPHSPSQLLQQPQGLTNNPQAVPLSQASQSNPVTSYYGINDCTSMLANPNSYPTMPSIHQQSADCLTQAPVIPTELYDFNLGNGGFDMDSDATRSLVQKLLS